MPDLTTPGRVRRHSSNRGLSNQNLRRQHQSQTDDAWGDRYKKRQPNTLRIAFLNIQGLPLLPFAPKHAQLGAIAHKLKCEFFGLAELNLQFNYIRSSAQWKERFRHFPRHHSIHATNRNFPKNQSPTLFGGVGQFSFSTLSHCALSSGIDPTGLGRWVWTRYQGRNGCTLRLITGYRPNPDHSDSTATVFSQHQRFLLEENDDRDPRRAFLEDLGTSIATWQSLGDQIVLCLDANEYVRSGAIHQFTRRWGLVDVHHARHPHLQPTATCSKSSTNTPIDGIWASRSIRIVSAGYLGFDELQLNHTDHRLLWVDLDLTSALQHPRPIQPYRPPMRLSLQDPRVVRKYNKIVRQQYSQINLPARLFALQAKLPHFTQEDSIEYHKLASVDYYIRRSAHKRCRKLRMGRYQFSDVLKRHSQEVLMWNMLRKRRLGNRSSVKKIRRLSKNTKIPNVFQFSLPQIESFRCQAIQRYKSVKKSSAVHAQRFHQKLLRRRATKFGTSEVAQEKILSRITQQRTTARRIREVTGPTPVALNVLDAPQINNQESRRQCQTKQEVEEACFLEGQRRFTQVYNTPFLTEPLLSLIGMLGLGPAVPSVLDGSFRPPESLDIYTKKFLQQLRKPIQLHSSLSLGITTPQHIAGWKKMKSKTSSSPHGPSFLDYIAGSEDPIIADVDATFATIPIITGHCPPAWMKATDVMIPKKADSVLVEKLRIIILFHALFNMTNKRLGREMIYNAEKSGLIPQEAYGSRRNHRAIECGLNKVLTADLSRQRRSPLALCSNDAVSCYDRIVHSVASLCMQRVGVSPQSCKLLFGTLENIQHFVRTTYGDSSSHYCGIQLRPLQGVGQGNGAGPSIWLVITIPLINMLRAEGYGFRFMTALSGESGYFVCYTFVDDTDLVHSSDTSEHLIQELQHMLDHWEGGLRATGGAINASKSYWYAFDFHWDGKKWRYTTVEEVPGSLSTRTIDGNRRESLIRLEPSEARETLGLWIALDGNQTAQFTALVNKAQTWAERIRAGRLNFAECWISLQTGIMKSLEYPLMATSLSRSQCKAIMKPLVQAALPGIHIAKNLPLVVRHGSIDSQGLHVPDIWVLQGIHKIWAYIRHGNQSTITGSLIRATFEQATLEVGINNLFTKSYSRYGQLITPCHLASLWTFLDCSQLHIQSRCPLIPTWCSGDQLLMEFFGNHSSIPNTALRSINLCRQWLQVLRISDITSGDGRRILESAWTGSEPSRCNTHLGWPIKTVSPSNVHWQVWRRYLTLLCHPGTKLLRLPLGDWTCLPEVSHHTWFYDATSDRVYQHENNHYKIFRRLAHRRLRRTRYLSTDSYEQHLPTTAIRTSVITYSPNVVIHTGTRPTYLSNQESLPVYNWAIRHTSFPSDVTLIIEAINNGTATGVCDGSYKEHFGTAAFCLCATTHTRSRIIGCNVTPGHPDDLTPYRSELGGIYGIVSVVHDLVKKYGITSGSITVACDCLSALKTIFEHSSDSPSQPDFDLVHDIRTFVQSSPIEWKWKHIYGHQDTHCSYQSLDWLAQTNIQMDLLAKQYWQLHKTSYHPYYVESPFAWTLWNQNSRYSCWDVHRLYDFATSPSLQNYWRRRHNIPPEVHIDWPSASAALQTSDLYHRLMIPKWLAGFMPTGKILLRRGISSSDACPRCGQSEDMKHIVTCSAPSATTRWHVALKHLHDWMVAQHTMPEIKRLILYHLKCWHDDDSPASLTPSSTLLADAIRDQTSIGWDGILHGFISIHWQQAQANYYAQIGSRQSGRRWTISIIKKGWSISWDMWDHRCSVRTSTTDCHSVEEHAHLNTLISTAYQQGTGGWRPQDQRWFLRTFPLLSQETLSYKQQWLSQIEIIRSRNLRRITSSEDRQRACFRRFFST